MQQLTMGLYELSKFHLYAKGGVEALFINLQSKLPTCMHSAGNQAFPCACGCRKAFSEKRIQAQGLVATIVPLPETQKHGDRILRHWSFLHPTEAWTLNGGSPKQSLGYNLRLALAGIGQSVSPIVGLWVLAHVVRSLDQVCGKMSPCDPSRVLSEYLQNTRQEASKMWPGVSVAEGSPTPEGVQDDPIEN